MNFKIIGPKNNGTYVSVLVGDDGWMDDFLMFRFDVEESRSFRRAKPVQLVSYFSPG